MIVNRKHAEEAWALLVGAAVNDPMEVGSDWPNLNGACEEAVKSAYKAAARKAHPDAGGSVEEFAAVDRAKHVLLKWLERQTREEAPAPSASESCPDCKGKGFVEQRTQQGFKISTLRVQCRKCRGTGELGVEHDKGDWG